MANKIIPIIDDISAIEHGFFDAIKTGDEYDRVYSVSDFNTYFEGLIRQTGVFKNVGKEFNISADQGMRIKIGSGKAMVGGHWVRFLKDLTMDIDVSTAQGNLTCAICLISSETDRTVSLGVYTGNYTSGTEFNRPITLGKNGTIRQYRSNDINVLLLANIDIPKGQNSIKQSDIHMIDFYADAVNAGSYVKVTGTDSNDKQVTTMVYSPELYDQDQDNYYNGYIESLLNSMEASGIADLYAKDIADIGDDIAKLKTSVIDLLNDDDKMWLEDILIPQYVPPIIDAEFNKSTMPAKYISYMFIWDSSGPSSRVRVKNTLNRGPVSFFCTRDCDIVVFGKDRISSVGVINNKSIVFQSGEIYDKSGSSITNKIQVTYGTSQTIVNQNSDSVYLFAYDSAGKYLGRTDGITGDIETVTMNKTLFSNSSGTEANFRENLSYILVLSSNNHRVGLYQDSGETIEGIKKDEINTLSIGQNDETNIYAKNNAAFIFAKAGEV